MKPGIFIAVAAMAIALVSAPDVEAKGWGWGGHDLHLRVAGSNYIVSNLPNGTPTPPETTSTSIANGIAKGSGGGIFSAQNVAQGIDPENPFDPRCEGTLLPLGNDIATTVVITQPDGSILSLVTAGSYYCTDGVTFVAEFGGNVLGGEGRYEGATGTWEGTAQVFQSRVTGTLDVDLD